MRTRRAERLVVHVAQQTALCCVAALRLGRGVAPAGCTKNYESPAGYDDARRGDIAQTPLRGFGT